MDKSFGFCEMLKEAHQRGAPFYFDKENEDCVGKLPLGMMDTPPVLEAGQLGLQLEIYQEPRANTRIYQHTPKFARGTVNYVVFSPLDKLTFEPDLLILYATPSQAEIVLRAMSYSTGEMWEPKAMPVVACAWLYVYPYQSAKVNYLVTGMSYGMIARKVFPEGRILIHSMGLDTYNNTQPSGNETGSSDIYWERAVYRGNEEACERVRPEIMSELYLKLSCSDLEVHISAQKF